MPPTKTSSEIKVLPKPAGSACSTPRGVLQPGQFLLAISGHTALISVGSTRVLENGSQYAIADFHYPTISTLAQIKRFVDSAHQNGDKVRIHCGAGAGRTGTVLASLVLADLVKEERARNPGYSSADAGKTVADVGVEYSHQPGKASASKIATTIQAPKIVADAIQIVRQADQDTAHKKPFCRNRLPGGRVDTLSWVPLRQTFRRLGGSQIGLRPPWKIT